MKLSKVDSDGDDFDGLLSIFDRISLLLFKWMERVYRVYEITSMTSNIFNGYKSYVAITTKGSSSYTLQVVK